MTASPDNIQTAIDAGKGLASKVETISGIPTLVGPNGATVLKDVLATADLRALMPRRRTGSAELQSIGSFCDHIKRFKSPDTAVWADSTIGQLKLVAVLNYHPAGADSEPAWGDHRATYPCPVSPEWKAWGEGVPVQKGQDDFAKFLDAHDRDLAVAGDADGVPYPTPADLMTLAATLESFTKTDTKRERVGNNTTLSFKEESGFKSPVVIPRAFAIKVPVFADAEPQVIEVRLRVEVKDNVPSFTWQIHDATKVLRLAFGQLVAHVAETTGAPVFIGTPEK